MKQKIDFLKPRIVYYDNFLLTNISNQMTEKTINVDLLNNHNVKLYDNTYDTYDIIKDLLANNNSIYGFYVVNLAEVVNSYNKWMELLPNITPYYAVKCNPDPVLIETLARLDCGFDCASENEIKIINDIFEDINEANDIINANENSSRIIFANPCKMPSHISFASDYKVNLMTFDCEDEIFKIRSSHPCAKLVLRLAVDDSQSLCKFNEKYGCDLSDVDDLLHLAKMSRLEVVGFSFHVGSGCLDPTKFYSAIKDCRTAYDIALKRGMQISLIDIGGGFPGEEKKIKFSDIAEQINKGIDEFFKPEIERLENENSNDSETIIEPKTIQFISEPGRYFAQKSHVLVLNVIGKKIKYSDPEKKIIKHINYTVNDGMYGSFNCIHYDYAEVTIIPFNKRSDSKVYKSTVFGPTCDSIDVIFKETDLPELYTGDKVYVENFGAYTISASSEFNGFKTNTNKYIYHSK
jgi:ornithine decarboxylase